MEERLKPLLVFIQDLVKFAEAKNAVLVAFNGGAILGVLKFIGDNTCLNEYVVYYLWTFVFFAACGLVVSLLSFLPRVKILWVGCTGEPQATDNLILFSDICKYEVNQYLRALYLADDKPSAKYTDFDKLYANQVIVNARIAMRKYTFFRKALWCTIAAVLTPVVGLILLCLLED